MRCVIAPVKSVLGHSKACGIAKIAGSADVLISLGYKMLLCARRASAVRPGKAAHRSPTEDLLKSLSRFIGKAVIILARRYRVPSARRVVRTRVFAPYLVDMNKVYSGRFGLIIMLVVGAISVKGLARKLA